MSEQLGKYRLIRHIGEGGMAEVFLARASGPEGFEKTCVVKRILPERANNERMLRMFLDEARLAARLAHPNVVQIFELGESDGQFFIAMEHIDGASLRDLDQMARRAASRLPLHYVAKIMARVCAGLDYAHRYTDDNGRSLGLVHRDVSPDNILISRDGAVKLIDFGVAKATSNRTQTQDGAIKGKYAYMSPEQVVAEPLDGRSDLFSVGTVLYELATGRNPFGDEPGLLTVAAIVNQEPRDIRELDWSIPDDFAAIVMKALQKDPELRFHRARDMGRDLEAFVARRGLMVSEGDLGSLVSGIVDGGAEARLTLDTLHAVFFQASGTGSGLAPRPPMADPNGPAGNAHGHGGGVDGAIRATQPAVNRGGRPGPPANRMRTPSPMATMDPAGARITAPRRRAARTGANPTLVAAVGLLIAGGAAAWWVQNLGREDDGLDEGRSGAMLAIPPGSGSPDIDDDPMLRAALEALDRDRAKGATLEVTSLVPGATVKIDGEDKGRTPLLAPVAPGKHQVEVTLGERVWKGEVDAPGGTRASVTAEFEIGLVQVRGAPEGARCRLGKEPLDLTRKGGVAVPVGRHVLRCSGGGLSKKRLDVERGARITLDWKGGER